MMRAAASQQKQPVSSALQRIRPVWRALHRHPPSRRRAAAAAAAAAAGPTTTTTARTPPPESSSSSSSSSSNNVDYQELQDSFARDGYCVVPQVLDRTLIGAIEAFSNAATAAMSPAQQEEHKFTGSLIPIVDPVFQPLLVNRATLAALDALGFGRDVKWSCGFIISKPPGGPSLAWHQDCAVWDHPVAYTDRPHQIL
jgi:hypothetical protein